MATQVLAEVLERTRARDTAWMVIVVLADHAGKETREAHCSLDFIVRTTHKSLRAVQYALRQLEVELGEVTTIRRGNGRKNVSTYRVNKIPEKGATVAPFNGIKDATVAPFGQTERVQLSTEKGATVDIERVQPSVDHPYSVNYSVCPTLKAHSRHEYPPEFESTWADVPPRLGSNPKRQAYQCWEARRKEGHKVEEIRAGVRRYRAFCAARGQIGTEYVMQAKRFFGPELEFTKPWPAQSGQPVQQGGRQARKTFDEYRQPSSEANDGTSDTIDSTHERLD